MLSTKRSVETQMSFSFPQKFFCAVVGLRAAGSILVESLQPIHFQIAALYLNIDE